MQFEGYYIEFCCFVKDFFAFFPEFVHNSVVDFYEKCDTIISNF